MVELIEDKIEHIFDKANDYERIKEKLIGETFEYIPEFNYIINGVLMRYEANAALIQFLRKNSGLITQTFNTIEPTYLQKIKNNNLNQTHAQKIKEEILNEIKNKQITTEQQIQEKINQKIKEEKIQKLNQKVYNIMGKNTIEPKYLQL